MTSSIDEVAASRQSTEQATRPHRSPAKLNDTRQHAAQRRSRNRSDLAALCLLAALTATACAPREPAPTLAGATRADLAGPWDFLQAGLAAAQSEHEMATLREWSPAPGVRVYEMLTITDERVLIRAETSLPPDEPGDAFAPADLTLAVRYGLWGNEQREDAIIRTIQDRLEHLRRNPPAR
jgi:hypothetical protein